MKKPTPEKQVLLVTRSDDNDTVERVSEALRHRGAKPIRLDTDLYPQEVQLSTRYVDGKSHRKLVTAEGTFDLNGLEALWYRRYFAGGRLPDSLGDMQEPSVNEARRTMYGTIAAFGCFELDPLAAVRKTDHKELQLTLARELGLSIPRTLFTNDPAAAREFYEALDGKVVTKMQSSFAIYRGGEEHVVFTNKVEKRHLDELDGLRFCPMTFQELVEKKVELRSTVVGKRVFTAAVDSQKKADTKLDWRRDGLGLIRDWVPYSLPKKVENALVALCGKFGLNYAAADFIVTQGGDHVFLEINAGGEWMWLADKPGLPIAGALADVLLGLEARNA